MRSFVVIAGMSGAGRTQSANCLEDLGWFVMDNLPPTLIPKVIELAGHGPVGVGSDPLALVVGTGYYHEKVVSVVDGLRDGIDSLKVVFLDAGTDELVRRYESTRRRHPFDEESTLAGAIEAERKALAPLKAISDVVIDTTGLNIHQLRDRMVELFGEDATVNFRTTVISFGYMHGIPRDVDIVLDCRFLPNPHWVEELRPLNGCDSEVFDYVMSQQVTKDFLERLEDLLELLLPCYIAEGKSYLSVAFGCTGGRHRSVAIAEHIANVLKSWGHHSVTCHRDIDK